MALAKVQTASQQAANASSISFTLGASPTVGNILVVFTAYSQFGGARSLTSPSGTWTKVFDVTANSSDSLACWWHTVVGGDSTGYTFTVNEATPDYVSGCMYEISGSSTVAPIDQSATTLLANTTNNVVTTPSVTPTALSDLALGCWTFDSNNMTYSSISSGWTLDGHNDAAYHGSYTGSKNSLTADTTTAVNVTFTATGSPSTNAGVAATVLIKSTTDPFNPIIQDSTSVSENVSVVTPPPGISKIITIPISGIMTLQGVPISFVGKFSGVYQAPLFGQINLGEHVQISENVPSPVFSTPPSGAAFGLASKTLLSLTSSQQSTWLTDYKNIGMKWARVDADWRAMEPSNGSYNFTAMDSVVTACNTAGVNLLMILTYCPSWAGSFNNLGGPPTNNSDFANFCSTLVSRYSARGVHAYEIWNEPNNSAAGYWASGTVSQMTSQYVPMLSAAYTAIKAADPTATVITGGVCPTGDPTRDPASYISNMYSQGASGHFDAIGVHPYTYPADPTTGTTIWTSMYTGTNNIRSTMIANGDTAKQIWNTEFGAPTSTAGNAVTQTQQANQLAGAIDAWQTYTWGGNMFLYTYLDLAAEPNADNEACFGLGFSNDGITKTSNKPSYASVQSAIASP